MNKPKAAIFDIDGTLTPQNSWIAFSQDIGASVADHLAIYSQHLGGEISLDESKKQLLAMWRATGKANKAHIQSVFKNWPVKEDARDLVDWLKSQGYSICLITGSLGVYAEHIARELGVDHYYANAELYFDEDEELTDFHYTANQAEVKLQQFTDFCEAQGIEPGDCIAVGDSDNDIELFRATKHGILIEGEKISEELRESAWRTIHQLNEVKDLLNI